ncbi:hypothetical protein ABZX04_20450, partial [Streptomyces rochei]
MRLALAEAGRAARGGDVPVGAVVLAPDGRTVLAAGHNEREARQLGQQTERPDGRPLGDRGEPALGASRPGRR